MSGEGEPVTATRAGAFGKLPIFADFLRQATVRYESGPSLGARGIKPSGRFFARHSSSCVATYLTAVIGADTDYAVVQN